MTKKPSSSGNRMRKNNRFLWLALIALVAALIYIFGANWGSSDVPVANQAEVKEPEFKQEGQLWFIRKEPVDTLLQVAIEIADDNPTRAQGMMYRTSMPDTQAMLFIFDDVNERTFWMKNTKMALDIMYVTEDLEIITIYKHTLPYSENPIPSFGEAKYVVETAAGFTDRKGIKEGDFISFEVGG